MSMAQSIPLHQHASLTPSQKLASVNEESWLQVGKVAEMMNELDRAVIAYESALRHNPYSIPAMNQIAAILRAREQFPRAVEFYQSILNLDQNNGDVWGALGHCYLMMDDLQKAYSAYQQALYHLQNPKEPKLWYGIGILYDRYGSLEHAEEAFSQVMRMDPGFEKANEIYFRLGIIYKQQHKYAESLACFRYIIASPPKPLTEVDVWFQIGHVYEQQKEYSKAKEAYERVLSESPDHAKVLQQLGWLYHQQSSTFANQDLAITYLTKSLESDGQDAQSWYLLGRCYMAQQKYNKAYEAYQQAVYRDGRNPTFWCSIGVLYYQINQYRDALDAYSRAIRLNPYISEVWYDLGTLYESCNNQVSDALDAYTRAAELDPGNPHIKSRLELLRSGQSGGAGGARAGQGAAPLPQDVNPNAYQNTPQGPPTQWGGSNSLDQHQQQQQQQQQHQQQHPQQQHAQHPVPPPLHQPHVAPPQHHQQQQHPAQHNASQRMAPVAAPANYSGRDLPSRSPEQSKHSVQANGGSRSSAKGTPVPTSQPPVQHYAAAAPAPPQTHTPSAPRPEERVPSMQQQPSRIENKNGPSSEGNLAPMLGRTSPVAEIKSLEAMKGHRQASEQPTSNGGSSLHAPAQSQGHGNGNGNGARQARATSASREPDTGATLKRPHSVMAEHPVDQGRESKKQAPETASSTTPAAAVPSKESETTAVTESVEKPQTEAQPAQAAVPKPQEKDATPVPAPVPAPAAVAAAPVGKPASPKAAQPPKQEEEPVKVPTPEDAARSAAATPKPQESSEQPVKEAREAHQEVAEKSTGEADKTAPQEEASHQRKISVDENYDE